MKTILTLLLFTSIAYAQPYIGAQFDLNNALGLRDNPRMVKQINGLDFDIELGAREENIAVFIFYGEFKRAFYKNYGVGLDYVFEPLTDVLISLGNRYHVVIRDEKYSYLGTTGSYLNPRGKISYDINGALAVELIANLTNRRDINKTIFEGGVGIKYNFKQ